MLEQANDLAQPVVPQVEITEHEVTATDDTTLPARWYRLPSGGTGAAVLLPHEFDAIAFDAIAFDAIAFDAIAFDAIAFDAIAFNTTAFDTTAINTTAFNTTAFNTDVGRRAQADRQRGLRSL